MSGGEVGVSYDFSAGDQTLVEVEMASIDPNDTSTPVMTLYALLALLEKKRLMLEHKVWGAS